MLGRDVDRSSTEWSRTIQSDRDRKRVLRAAGLRPPAPGWPGVFVTGFARRPAAEVAEAMRRSGGTGILELSGDAAAGERQPVGGRTGWRFAGRWRVAVAGGTAFLEVAPAASDGSELVLYLERPGQPWLRPLWPRRRLQARADRLMRSLIDSALRPASLR